ncbi:MAG: hypothetical protein ACYDDS_15680 [Candidatus Sulfotelmatobacter sp.]|jgi:hypothetical protein
MNFPRAFKTSSRVLTFILASARALSAQRLCGSTPIELQLALARYEVLVAALVGSDPDPVSAEMLQSRIVPPVRFPTVGA